MTTAFDRWLAWFVDKTFAPSGGEPQEGSPLIADASASPSALVGGPSSPELCPDEPEAG